MKAVVASFNQEKALVGAFSVITNLRKEHIEALIQRLLLLLQTMENAITEQSGAAETEQGNIRHIYGSFGRSCPKICFRFILMNVTCNALGKGNDVDKVWGWKEVANRLNRYLDIE